MAKCWTCGTPVAGWSYTCSACKGLTELKNLQNEIESHSEDIAERIDSIEQSLLYRFRELGGTISEGLSEIASAIEWGFGELSWQIQQQTDVLKSIDHTLKTPSETKAKEWRLHAEELRRRGVLEESEEFFLKALNEYRLDFRIYVGLAETYLKMNKFDKAKVFLEKSLPHAPKEIQDPNVAILDRLRDFLLQDEIEKVKSMIIYHLTTGLEWAEAENVIDQIADKGRKAELGLTFDWKSHSYRLIGHIHACEGDYSHAMDILRTAIELSPCYEEGYYDFSQYCSQMRNTKDCLDSLSKAILLKPLYWYLAQKERNFDPIRSEVEKLLANRATEVSNRAKDTIAKSENAIKEAKEAVSKAKQALIISKDKSILNSSTMVENAEMKLKLAKDRLASGDYIVFWESLDIAVEAYKTAKKAADTAYEEKQHFQKRRTDKVKNAWGRVPGAILGWPLLYGFLGWLLLGFGGCTIRVLSGYKNIWEPFNANAQEGGFGFLIGIIGGAFYGIYNIKKELE